MNRRPDHGWNDKALEPYECSWPECGCDPSGIESPPCRAQHANDELIEAPKE